MSDTSYCFTGYGTFGEGSFNNCNPNPAVVDPELTPGSYFTFSLFLQYSLSHTQQVRPSDATQLLWVKTCTWC